MNITITRYKRTVPLRRGASPRRCTVMVEVQSPSFQMKHFYRRWDNKGWYFYSYYVANVASTGEDDRVYAPTVKAAIAMWRLSR